MNEPKLNAAQRILAALGAYVMNVSQDPKPRPKKIRYGDSLRQHFDRVNFEAWKLRQDKRKVAAFARALRHNRV